MPQLVTIPEDSIVEIHDVTVKRGCYGLVSRMGLMSGPISDTDASRLSSMGLRLTGPSRNSMGIPGRSVSVISAVRAATPSSSSTSSSHMPGAGLTSTLFGLMSSPSSTFTVSGSRVFREGLRTRTETLNRAIVSTGDNSYQARGECTLTCALRAASALRKSTRFDVLSQIRGKYSMLLAKTENAQRSSCVKPVSKVPLVHSIAEFRQRKLKRVGREQSLASSDQSLNSSDEQSTFTVRSSPRENRVAFSENRRLTSQNSNEFLTSRLIEVHSGLPKLLLSKPHAGTLSGTMCVSGVQFNAKSTPH